MNRGSVTQTGFAGSMTQGFNEAPIHESGKCPPEEGDEDYESGFNEAPIHESGKSVAGYRPSR